MLKLLKSRKCSDDSVEFEFSISDISRIVTAIDDIADIHIGTINATTLTNKKIEIYSTANCVELSRAGLLSNIEYIGAFNQKRILFKLDIIQDKVVVSLQNVDDLLGLTKLLEVYCD